ncbi:LOW QUALITY PROTEIN: tripartite motif-containing protein 15 [Eumetopias jubatus]|uniref:LOW QUALITY PROTEIN: tripartite motif-containing protein 15 n=1 Tax=Eumetopias jubatus TaxID=34886 RepID=UPI001015D59F|nr:LOW QUALITY PROTEIN: tripartite motif-containing protein 15 [Eumetopias jubatus]
MLAEHYTGGAPASTEVGISPVREQEGNPQQPAPVNDSHPRPASVRGAPRAPLAALERSLPAAGDGTGVSSTPSHEETTCLDCRGPQKDAVTSACGHTFCGAAVLPLSQMGAQPSGQGLLCAICQEKEPTETLVAPVLLDPLEETRCEQHDEKIYFFCKVDAEFLCMVCREGPSHCTHPVGVLDAAVQPYRDHLRNQSEALSLEKKEMEDTRRREDRKLQALLTHIESKKQQVDTVFERLQQELMDQQRLLQARLRELETQIHMERDEYTFRSSEEVARLGAQAQELKEQSQQPARALLQDVRGNQSRYETKTFVSPETISPDLVEKIRDLHRKILPLPVMLRTFSENLAHHLETDSGAVTLDAQTASRSLALSEDRKLATFPRDKQIPPHSPLRSKGVPAARGSPGCPSGRHHRQVQPGARGEAGSEEAGPALGPAAFAPAAPGAHLPGSALPRSGTPPSPPASPQTPLLRGLRNGFLPG